MRWWCRHSKSAFPWGRSPPSSGSSRPSARSIRQWSRGPPSNRVLAKVWWDGSSATAQKTMPQHGRDDTLQLLNFSEFFYEVVRAVSAYIKNSFLTSLLGDLLEALGSQLTFYLAPLPEALVGKTTSHPTSN